MTTAPDNDDAIVGSADVEGVLGSRVCPRCYRTARQHGVTRDALTRAVRDKLAGLDALAIPAPILKLAYERAAVRLVRTRGCREATA